MLVAFVFALALSACGGASAEDLIRADLESYFGDPENAAEEFASGLEESAGDEHDMLGITNEFSPRFLRRYADLHSVMTEAFSHYVSDVKGGDFPSDKEQY